MHLQARRGQHLSALLTTLLQPFNPFDHSFHVVPLIRFLCRRAVANISASLITLAHPTFLTANVGLVTTLSMCRRAVANISTELAVIAYEEVEEVRWPHLLC